jgi:hypothetical protein
MTLKRARVRLSLQTTVILAGVSVGFAASGSWPPLPALGHHSSPIVTQPPFKASEQFGGSHIQRGSDLHQRPNIRTPQSTLDKANRRSIRVHLSRQPVLGDVLLFANLAQNLAQLLLQALGRLDLLFSGERFWL